VHSHDRREPLTPGVPVRLEIELWPTSIVVPAGFRLALSVLGRDYEYAQATGARLSNFKNELRGCGPFLHDDPVDRPAELFHGRTSIHVSRTAPAFLLLPIVPPRVC
jgi:predicted acyl esterase